MLVGRFASLTHNDQQKISILESINTPSFRGAQTQWLRNSLVFRQILLPRLRDQDDNVGCPRKNSAALIRRFPSSCTSPSDNAPSPAATTSSALLGRIFPGFPRRLITVAEKILRLCMPFVETVINAAGHGSNARMFLSIASAGADQSILPSSRYNFGA